eukprot:m.453371 g.453371  ORF g.453371 m.453371 type:complete len:66 (+) comp56935_c0_seq5:174-371(+)
MNQPFSGQPMRCISRKMGVCSSAAGCLISPRHGKLLCKLVCIHWLMTLLEGESHGIQSLLDNLRR